MGDSLIILTKIFQSTLLKEDPFYKHPINGQEARRKEYFSICVCLTLSGLCWAKKTGIYTRHAYRIIIFSPWREGRIISRRNLIKYLESLHLAHRQFCDPHPLSLLNGYLTKCYFLHKIGIFLFFLISPYHLTVNFTHQNIARRPIC